MAILRRMVWLLAIGVTVAHVPVALASSNCEPDGLQASGSIYRICMPAPEDYNGYLIVWAHGFQDATEPVSIPEDQLVVGDISIPGLINDLGFGFATNSYSKTGLAVRQGIDDLLDLVNIYAAEHGAPTKVFLTGASEGGLITALLVEGHPEVFAGGVAACGPVGDFAYQINYFGDARATFEYFFPGLIPGDPFNPSPELVAGWEEYYATVVEPQILAPENRDALDQWVRVAALPVDPARPLESIDQDASDVLRYTIVNLHDASETLGGFPFGNRYRYYRGSSDDVTLNREVLRVTADPVALEEMHAHYDTTGALDAPLITIHTRLDQQVPYFHEVLYTFKNLREGSFLTRRINIPIDRWGHCNFTKGEAMFALGLLLFRTGDLALLSGVGSVLGGQELATFEALARQYGVPYSVEGSSLGVGHGQLPRRVR